MRTTSHRIGALGSAILILASVAACGSPAVSNGRPPTSPEPDSPKVSALNIAFDRTEVTVPSARAFILVFENAEKIPHNIVIYADEAMQERVYEGETFEGPASRLYSIPALAPGIYTFICSVHPIPAMTGTMLAL